jgi:thiol-disulfide isomerase/thioredoxin
MKNIFILTAALLFATASFAQTNTSVKVPEISLKDTSGKTVTLSSLKGKVVLIDFWASWCGPCRRANKHLKTLYAKYKDQGLVILSISVDEDKSAWKKAINEDKTTWLHVLDDMNYANAWKIQYIPTTFIVDKKGNFAAVNPELEELEKLIKPLL